MLFILVAIALVCERVFSLSMSLDPELRAFWTAQARRLAEASVHASPAASTLVLDAPLLPLLAVALLFGAGMLLLLGVVTLIRDLLLRGQYRSRRVLRRGGRYFWPVLRYKLPVYVTGSVFSSGIAAAVWNLRSGEGPGALASAVALGLLWLSAFAVARVFLSLGTKVIVSEPPIATAAVYRRVWRIVRPHLGAVAVFYALVLALTAVTTLAVWGLSSLPAPAALRVAVTIALLAAVTLVMKVAAFDLYLQLAGHARPLLTTAD